MVAGEGSGIAFAIACRDAGSRRSPASSACAHVHNYPLGAVPMLHASSHRRSEPFNTFCTTASISNSQRATPRELGDTS